jgi:O-antigen biosynthesis protein WbqV
LFENCEFNLYAIDYEISKKYPALSLRPIVGDVRNKERVDFSMQEEKPELIFHAAALKHVPMTEKNIIEGIMTNALGTKIVADACEKHGVKAMVMISTDKAVNPSSVMGATKRLAESYCQAMDIFESKNKPDEKATRYVTVRFGNVLGSTGSVVPLFQKQLAAGGPLTVTHPDIKRYFMTIKEAVELVLQASALGSRKSNMEVKTPELHGKIFVLEMGEPVFIADLARQVIRLAGLKPDEDIKITYTGLRPGEKLFEEIFYGNEDLVETGSKGILLAEPRALDKDKLADDLQKLLKICAKNNPEEAKNMLHELVPEFVTPKI